MQREREQRARQRASERGTKSNEKKNIKKNNCYNKNLLHGTNPKIRYAMTAVVCLE